MIESAQERLAHAAQAIAMAEMMLRTQRPTMEAFLKECADMESFGPILDPTLYRDSTRRAASALVKPLFEAAIDFLRVYDLHVAKAKTALVKVSS